MISLDHNAIDEVIDPIFTMLANSDMQVGKLKLKRKRFYQGLNTLLANCSRQSDEELLIYNVSSLLERCAQCNAATPISEWLSKDSTSRVYLNEARLLKKKLTQHQRSAV